MEKSAQFHTPKHYRGQEVLGEPHSEMIFYHLECFCRLKGYSWEVDSSSYCWSGHKLLWSFWPDQSACSPQASESHCFLEHVHQSGRTRRFWKRILSLLDNGFPTYSSWIWTWHKLHWLENHSPMILWSQYP